jgi:hypothetical protein
VDFDATIQRLIIYSAYKILEKKWEYNEAVHKLYKYFKEAYDSVSSCIIFSLSLVSP